MRETEKQMKSPCVKPVICTQSSDLMQPKGETVYKPIQCKNLG